MERAGCSSGCAAAGWLFCKVNGRQPEGVLARLVWGAHQAPNLRDFAAVVFGHLGGGFGGVLQINDLRGLTAWTQKPEILREKIAAGKRPCARFLPEREGFLPKEESFLPEGAGFLSRLRDWSDVFTRQSAHGDANIQGVRLVGFMTIK